MPSRNVVKIDVPQSYYHVYARGHGRRAIFREDKDYIVFLSLFKRHLSVEPVEDKYSKQYTHLRDQLELLCYCLMPNHFHLLLYQKNEGTMQRFMRRVMTSYSRYFNTKYNSSGALFESRYKASRISSDAYLSHISRYIHLNPKDWRGYSYSSVHAYFGIGQPEWLQQERITCLFKSLPHYADFLSDYESHKLILDEIKHELANNL
ncbi:MAG TPA: transposase [Candidatus Saccharimonadales bacterium]